jgi:hypothetical protein
MANLIARSFDDADERRNPPKAAVEVLTLGSVNAARMTLQPGWSWSECIKPIVGTESCQVRHVGTAIAGTLRVTHNDGSALEVTAGDGYVIEPGHDASVVGDEAFVAFEFESDTAKHYAETPA